MKVLSSLNIHEEFFIFPQKSIILFNSQEKNELPFQLAQT
jgi:hypothetical protein